MKKPLLLTLLIGLLLAVMTPSVSMASEKSALESAAADSVAHAEGKKIDPKEIIFEHLGDGYGWEVPFSHDKRIPLPVIIWGEGGLHMFSSARVTSGQVYTASDGVQFKIAGKEEPNHGKIVEMKDDKWQKPGFDFSITKNVCAIFIASLIVIWLVLNVSSYYKKNGFKAPRGMRGAMESLIVFLYDGMIKPTLKKSAPKFAPYLLTVFLFILISNLMGLIVVFPGGANVTGNIAVTLVLALITFICTNLFATKHYWKEIFWPDVPLMLKFPIPIMQIIEFFGIFTKPAALTVRLFANMMGGHMIVIVLTLLIFIFAAMGGAALGGATMIVSVLFSVFMLLIDVLVSFIQAYVFTMLSTVFIGLAQEEEEHEEKKHEEHEEHEKALKAAASATAATK